MYVNAQINTVHVVYTYLYILHIPVYNTCKYTYMCGKWPNRIHTDESWGNKYIYIYTHNYIHMCIVSWFVWICMVYKDERGATEDILCGDAFAG